MEGKRTVLHGKPVSPGAGMAEILRFSKGAVRIPEEPAEDAEQEAGRFIDALHTAAGEIKKLHADAVERLGEKEGEIFDAHLSILTDEYSVVQPVKDLILTRSLNAAQAVETQFSQLIGTFAGMDDPLFKERAADMADLKDILIRLILGIPKQTLSNLGRDVIILADDLSPSDTIGMDAGHIAGIATRLGGPTSHMAIIASALGIPAVIQIEGWDALDADGVPAILDASGGTLTLYPAEEDVAEYRHLKQEMQRIAEENTAYLSRESITRDGERFHICANIGTAGEAAIASGNGAEGIGLFRSEFLFLNRGDVPAEDEQFEAYRSVLKIMGSRRVIIRTLDVGGDKELPALNLPPESNPFLGHRAIRLCLDRTDIFMPQLRALLRASAFGNLGIMFPMISSLRELRAAKALLAEAADSLEREGTRTGTPETGMMVEIPAAAILAEKFAEEVDFFSIGTNDLTQYTLAAERGNIQVERLLSPFHPAVLRLISITAEAASKAGILCGMCGEAAGDPLLLPVFAGMGIRELSMSPSKILPSRKRLCALRMDECTALARKAVALSDEDQIKALLKAGC
jgi:phosphotransferase system enzyme I (PtsI)